MGIIPFYFVSNCFLLPNTRYFLLWFVWVTSKFSMKDWFANCALQKAFVSLHKNLYLIGDVDNMKSVPHCTEAPYFVTYNIQLRLSNTHLFKKSM